MQRVSRLFMLGIFVFALAACSSGPAAPPPDSCSTVPPAALYAGAYLADPHYCMFTFASGLTGAAPARPRAQRRPLRRRQRSDHRPVRHQRRRRVRRQRARRVRDRPRPQPRPRDHRDTRLRVVADGRLPLALRCRRPRRDRPDRVRRQRDTVRRARDAHPRRRRTEPPLRQHRQRQQRRHPRESGRSARDARADPPLQLAAVPAGGYAVGDGEVFAYGLRNEVGLSIDSKGRLWGVENGRDNLMLGGDIHYDNPAEEVNLFDVNKPGRDYGYPHCWSEGIWMDTAMAKGPGTQHLDPDQPGSYTEAKCQDPTRSYRPRSRWARTSRRSTSSSTAAAATRATCRATCSWPRTARGTVEIAQVGR